MKLMKLAKRSVNTVLFLMLASFVVVDAWGAPLLVAQPSHLVFSAIAGQPCTNIQALRILTKPIQ
jgi:hypothetical protein